MIPLYKPYVPSELPELMSILYSGSLSYGKYGQEFEFGLRNFIGNDNVISVNTYSNAIHIALSALGLIPGDEVIASPMACLASNQPLITYGLTVKWADIDPITGTLNPESVETAITKKTRLIFHNHFCGYVGYVDDINRIAHKYGILVIDDCVESFGSEFNGLKMGNLGTDASVFSFQTVRLPNTIEGGAIAFSNSKHMSKAIQIRDFGIDRFKFRDINGEISPSCDIELKGYSGMMSEINSYIGIRQIDEIGKLIEHQRANAEKWIDKIEDLTRTASVLSPLKGVKPNYWVFGILSKNKEQDMLNFRHNGYYSSSVHLPNNYYSVFGNYNQLIGVQEFYSKFLALPSGWWANI